MLTRKLADESAHTTLFYSALVGTVLLTLALPWVWTPTMLSWRQGAPFVLLGLFAGAGHWFVIGAYRDAPASLLTPFTYLQMIWAIMYGYLVFDQLPDGVSVLGMGVIVASGLFLALQERWSRRASRSSGPSVVLSDRTATCFWPPTIPLLSSCRLRRDPRPLSVTSAADVRIYSAFCRDNPHKFRAQAVRRSCLRRR